MLPSNIHWRPRRSVDRRRMESPGRRQTYCACTRASSRIGFTCIVNGSHRGGAVECSGSGSAPTNYTNALFFRPRIASTQRGYRVRTFDFAHPPPHCWQGRKDEPRITAPGSSLDLFHARIRCLIQCRSSTSPPEPRCSARMQASDTSRKPRACSMGCETETRSLGIQCYRHLPKLGNWTAPRTCSMRCRTGTMSPGMRFSPHPWPDWGSGNVFPGHTYVFDSVFETEEKTVELYDARTKPALL